jgi:hypothetical protein
LDIYQETVPLPISNRPKGYEQNDHTKVPDFIIPCGDGYFQPVYWVKQMAKGQVVGLPQEYTLGQTPFVMKIYVSLAEGNEDNLGPVNTLKPWLLDLLSGLAVHFGMLLKHVKTTSNWGMVREVL